VVELNPKAIAYGKYMKISFIASLVLFTLAGYWILEDVFAQGPPPSSGPPKVDIFAVKQSSNSILVTWENPDDTADGIVFRYTVSRDVNRTENFVEVFSSLRDIEQKIIDEDNGQEMFFYLDTDIKPAHTYEYRISAGNIQGNPNPTLSDDTKQIYIQPFSESTNVRSHGHLIQGVTLTPIQPIVSWYDWLNPFQYVSAEFFTNSIFDTPLNPQTESYRLALEPIIKPQMVGDCSQVLEFEYTKDDVKGQDFQIVTSLFEIETQTDDDTGVEVSEEVPLLRHQKTFYNFSDSIKLRQKWMVISPEDQQIYDFSKLEVQFDITANSGDPRSLSIWDVNFLIPSGLKAC